ncbi:alpha/beta hydrolase [Algoriphagus sp. NG3]|uniref:alpha/beta hydrolase n=1 Tax=unclassified Algoriphagus TaxID=2641541 RepID=UPI002A7ED88B|nr:alpha/beta fold hydrolase [Algoriphagus sp. NG3]WPR77274.1 alpha/beta fold hydrolase [Algoriphagus sp. NG3]
MKIIKILRFLFSVVVAFVGIALILVYYPVPSRAQHVGISEERATVLRNNFKEPHHLIQTNDGETLFLRRWNPDSLFSDKKEIAILILHGITAHSGAYEMAGKPFSESGYTTFGLDYRGHGLSGGNRGDSPGMGRWITDMAETVAYIKELGFSEVVVLGHSMGVAATFYLANEIPEEMSGVVLLSGAYEGREGLSKPPSFMDKVKFLANAVFRPSHQSVDYYREGMTVTQDSLFTMSYTPRFLMMVDEDKLRLPKDMNIPVLVGVGDKDELFTVEKVKELYDLIPGDKKEFLVMENTTHSVIPRESWMEIVSWLDRNYMNPDITN